MSVDGFALPSLDLFRGSRTAAPLHRGRVIARPRFSDYPGDDRAFSDGPEINLRPNSTCQSPIARVGWLVMDRDKLTLWRDAFGQGHCAAMLPAVNLRHDDSRASRKRGRGGGNNPFGGDLAEFQCILAAFQPQSNTGGIARG